MRQDEFMVKIIDEICNYAVENSIKPDDALSAIANNIKTMLQISTFNGWVSRTSRKDD